MEFDIRLPIGLLFLAIGVASSPASTCLGGRERGLTAREILVRDQWRPLGERLRKRGRFIIIRTLAPARDGCGNDNSGDGSAVSLSPDADVPMSQKSQTSPFVRRADRSKCFRTAARTARRRRGSGV